MSKIVLTALNQKVLDFVSANPGATLNQISRKCKCDGEGQIRRLRAARKVKRDRDGRLVVR